MDVPERWREYPCEDYYASSLAVDGYLDAGGELWLIEPSERVEEEADQNFLQVGRPGFDGIGFGYRKSQPGFWALHRVVAYEFQYLAPTVHEFLEGWLAGRISI